MAISEDMVVMFAKVFIGDIEEFYTYKSGPEIVTFFNTNFGFSDTYRQGFPSRWIFATDKITSIVNDGRLNAYLELILSKKYIMKDTGLNEVESLERKEIIIDYFNGQLKAEGYRIFSRGEEIELIQDDSDLEYIGGGGFADVYRSKSTGLVVKKLRDDFKTRPSIRHRFRREYDITNELSDIGGIINVYKFDEDDFSYSMEFGETTLEKYIKEYELPEESKITIIRQILHIMKLVHERNKIHRDISPNNVLLFSGQLKVTDFGLGKDLDMFHSHRTMYTNNFGQYHYCAPEQFMQLKDGNKRSDVFSLGSLINFILTEDPRNTRHFLRNPVEKAKNENPTVRYEDAGKLLEGVEYAIKYHHDANKEALINEKILKKIYDDDIENYLYSLDYDELCKAIVTNQNMSLIVRTFLDKNPNQVVNTLNGIDSEYCDVCNRFEDYDDFASIAYHVIKNNFEYVAQEIAAGVLNHVAHDVNRFSALRLIDDLISSGVDPIIEEIIS